ncbi:MAG: phosphoribosylamine--glycine ligase [Fusobacteria bacterium]|nr:MAG: phosphoribosylamine--glycine ligase [Fusobacteriota bacterium]KAF0229231.1 MAG: phosphoribosylamine--glycine [Fusobacteriota bacterium]
MKILVIGGGGREHALILKLKESRQETEIFVAPGNGGISKIAQCVNIAPTDVAKMTNFAIEKNIDLVIVTPDDPLVMGMVDALENQGIKAFGPRSVAAVLEGSKSFAKSFMKRHGIPTAEYQNFTSYGDAKEYIRKQTKYPIVIKADGLALGKGVVIAQNETEALEAIKNMMLDQCFGNSGSQIVIEEFLTGTEISVMAITDGKIIRTLTSAMDHKRAFDNDLGLNTGGMGAIAPHPLYTLNLAQECNEKIFKPTIVGMLEEDRMFKGILYFGLMLTKDGPYVIEYNCRFGDPETQVVLPLLDGDLLELILAVCDGQLENVEVKQKPGTAVCVVMASGGYPLAYEKGYIIEGLEVASLLTDTKIYHAGTTLDETTGNFLTAGGRVLGVTAIGNTLDEAIEKAYKAVNQITFEKAYYRTDIGKKAGGN